MPRLFTALQLPPAAASELALLRGGLAGARWVEPDDLHVTLRFFGDVDGGAAREIAAGLAEARPRAPVRVTFDGLGAFGGERPRILHARIRPSPDLAALQAEHETLARRAGLEPEARKFTPHVTLARLRGARSADVAAFLARAGLLPPLAWTAERVVLLSSRDSVGGGPYRLEAAFPLGGAAPRLPPISAPS